MVFSLPQFKLPACSQFCDMENQRLKAHQTGVVTEPKAKLRRGEQGGSARCAGRQWAVSEGVAIAAGEPEMEINPEVAEKVDVEAASSGFWRSVKRKLVQLGFAQDAPAAIPLGMEERLELSMAALCVKHFRLSVRHAVTS